MNAKRKCHVLALLFTMILLLSGCGENSVETDTSAMLAWETVSERVQSTSKLADYDVTVYNGITYYFESAIFSEEDRIGHIADIDIFYAKVRQLLPDTANQDVTVCIGNSLSTQGVTGKAFIQSQDITSYRGMTAVLLSAMSEAVNYGQAYGIAAFLCKDLGLSDYVEEPLYSDSELARYYGNTGNLCFLDFFLPAFETQYVDEETVAYVQTSAVAFEAYYIGQAGLENALSMCAKSAHPESDVSLEKEKNIWLGEIGSAGSYRAVPYVIPFSYNLKENRSSYPYVVFTDSAEWYPDLADIGLMGYADFIAGFAETLKYHETDFAQAREILYRYIESDIPAVTIYTDFADDSDLSQIFGAIYFNGNYIRLYHNWSIAERNLLHEYVHYLTMRHGINKPSGGFWAEGIAEETAVIECDNRLTALYMDSIMTEENSERAKQCGMWDYEKSGVDMRLANMAEAAYMYLGYGYDMEYLSVGQEVITRTADMAESIRPDWLTYSEAAGMIAYLGEVYGKNVVYENCRDINRLEYVLGKTFPELYDEWGKWNLEKCGEAGIDMDTLIESLQESD